MMNYWSSVFFSLCVTLVYYYSSWSLGADCKFGVGSEVLDLVLVRAARHRSYYLLNPEYHSRKFPFDEVGL